MSKILHPGLSLRTKLGEKYANSAFFKQEGAFSSPFPSKQHAQASTRKPNVVVNIANEQQQPANIDSIFDPLDTLQNTVDTEIPQQSSSPHSLSDSLTPAPKSKPYIPIFPPIRTQHFSNLGPSCIPLEIYEPRKGKAHFPTTQYRTSDYYPWMFAIFHLLKVLFLKHVIVLIEEGIHSLTLQPNSRPP